MMIADISTVLPQAYNRNKSRTKGQLGPAIIDKVSKLLPDSSLTASDPLIVLKVQVRYRPNAAGQKSTAHQHSAALRTSWPDF